jgi:predicted DNA-binding protein
MTVTKNISLPDEVDTRLRALTREEAPSVSAFITTAVQRELERVERNRATGEDDVITQVSNRDGKVYRFHGRFLDESKRGAFYAPTDADHLIVVHADDGHPEVISNADVSTWFGDDPIPEGVAAEYGLDAAVWL